ncbi:Phosphate-specific transport system accessory protein PhoU [Spiroplasma sp. JKS002669]|uniref:phosphate signaling complex protein PhoU n=1 Tax=Spiroplasma attinicola TaxID=2904537 RepID=UPI002022E52B|nr:MULTISPECIES: phosphate signaling complex protein PhoU [unclassified Spiroplasma]MCL6429150.1 Phosphate-specific transport system accessory protein PhoU [Spiroplasma sp. JKS002669]MCL8209530.1 Phosphate-specific transport system accessory protein PhoU [Spiroplasma sp. JKS002670]MCL8210349.1 Phosphate-specific transport system accessory protein PhoU [Spiroplasma sp. JKS002671]
MIIKVKGRFDSQIRKLKEDVLDLLFTVKKELQDSLTAIQKHEYEISNQIIENDKEIRKVAESLTTTAIWRIASQQPFATDLRTIIGYMYIIRDLERISNYAKNISKFNVKYKPEPQLVKEISNLMTKSFEMIDLIAKAIAEENVDLAYEAAKKDNLIDKSYKEAIERVTNSIKDDIKKDLIKEYTVGIQQLKYIERLGDHLVNICETIVYMAKGKFYDLSMPTENQ